MSPGSARTAESCVLGESWVVASTSSLQKEHLPEESDRNAQTDQEDERKECQSMTTSASSISGPELIMPSICEVPISEASWVAPELRSRTLPAHTVKRRHKRLSDRSGKKRESEALSSETSTTARKSQGEEIVSTSSGTTSSSARIERYIRPLINLLLMAAISHLLILPELVQQYQTLCSIETVSVLYPASCIPPYPQPPSTNPQMQSHPNSILTSQSRLESLFNTTLTQMSILQPTLQQTEPLLRNLHANLKKAYPATKHELDLEFAGCTQAARTATDKFASLKADINSAMDSLLATAATDDTTGTGRGRSRGGSRSVAQDARLSTQLARREAYLDQLTARMQSKAEALCGDFATLDDHLDSIQEIVQREMRAPSSFVGCQKPPGNGPSYANANANGKGIWGFIETIVPFTGRLSPVRTGEDETSTSEIRGNTDLSDSLRQATDHHRPVADLIRRLYIDLQNLQRKKGNLV
ncbi:uncharacterized protein NFIA_009240 [Aspergillus fischeri NRRL 181]|uniref:Uncharacterized protein n=1 Tax=Neosartorya fischeri (strain ATCC 1020 / DSM 3700 / CBS 544.65 / FGSC A1164 / JCM 1740 / NRRL 181 / WB 181) TaxID=331117 RepID=A1D1F2_NEOFI|nr:conserved hypothetical protein [Aspergillus fischeri NRRL 181]EAW22245.1 conserved hypothetical protein [Aspergillus fischeri NRRL 181]KAG2012538.1 hypothetical protein GB937_007133 [Aspergillus fischeri]